ncbi:deaminase domain-containing protein [Paenibacillus sp. FSL R10-2736]|uniref:deaminase domain-containing protein n=1 Tax=Paenibacillus sp. FSL R10-2736 TaxID=2954692 RepID=UPI0030F68DAF
MATTKLLFNVDEVERLRTKIGLVSQDTNRLHLQFKGKASDWGGIPLGQELLKAQVLIKELTSEAEKLEDLIRSAVQGFQSVQAENKRQASQLSQQLGVLAGLFGSAGSRGSFGPLSIPFLAQKAVTSLIRTLTILSARDEWSSDPVVQKLRGMIQQSGLVSIDGLAAEMKLKEIYEAREQIGKSQIAYEVYKNFGNQAQMEAAHQQAEEARKKLKSMGISEVQYQPGKDLSGYYKQSAIKACDYDPSITDKSVPLLEKEEYALLLRMAMEPGIQGEWAKQQLALIQPEATIGPVDPRNSVSEADILNRNDPAVIERLKGTYWVTLPAEEQDRIYEELKAYYEKLDKEAADQDRLARSGVGNQTVANILMGGSNMMVQAINTATFGLPRMLGDWIAGPMPEGYVNPMDDPYGKKAGQIAGTFISIGLPWKFLGAVKTPGVVGKFSPTLLKSMVAGAISGTLEETMDAINDYRDDGKQSVGERLISVGVNTTIAGAGDALFTAVSKGLSSVKKLVNGSIREVEFKEVDGTAKGKAGIDEKAKELEEVRSGGTGEGGSVNRAFREATEQEEKLIDDVRKRFNAGKSKNVAVTKGEINGEPINLESMSGYDPKNPYHKDNYPKPPENHYKYRGSDNNGRLNDTEQKMIEYLRERFKNNPNVEGNIEIISYKTICRSCNDIVDQFQMDFPNIKITRVQILVE